MRAQRSIAISLLCVGSLSCATDGDEASPDTTTSPAAALPGDWDERLAYVEELEAWMAQVDAIRSTVDTSPTLIELQAAVAALESVEQDVGDFRQEYASWFPEGECDPGPDFFEPVSLFVSWARAEVGWRAILAGDPVPADNFWGVEPGPLTSETALADAAEFRVSAAENLETCRGELLDWIEETEEVGQQAGTVD